MTAIIVTGSRHWTDYPALATTLDAIECPTILIHGAARGADSLAHRWAQAHGVPIEVFPADWARLGKAGGMARNRAMATRGLAIEQTGQAVIVVAFPLADSIGTVAMMRHCRSVGLTVLQHR